MNGSPRVVLLNVVQFLEKILATVRMNDSNYNNNALTLYLMDRCAIFIDGGYLEEVLIKKGKPKIDFKKLSEKISDNMTLLKTYYYTAMPHQSNPPTDDEKVRYRKKQSFIKQLKKIPRFEVKLGRLQKTHDGIKAQYKQKGVDMMLGVDLLKMSCKKQIQSA
ncbi:MAG: NYN domain-containing protein, partial [Thaumarchaeota archaeon]|nr:NYN domain-containing protein [Nitrososphaerota archaeon]